MRLILMRHAKSDWSTPGQNDFDRPLNARGRRSARALGRWLRDQGYRPDEVLCSSARRTVETFEGLGLDARPEFLPDLYHAEPEDMARVLSGATGKTVLMIGHNPGIGAWAARIVRAAPDHPRFHDFPTGATLVVDFDAPDWPSILRGTATDFVVPRELDD